ncbi:MAG: NADH-quinone oxidoreductase subunit N [candidate division Zixibacteria bacterium]|nr:NADH-quinone oxidoreductase subunit N [candidate division Zixibacteria bacterium]
MPQLDAAININIVLPEISLLIASFLLLTIVPLAKQRIISSIISLASVAVSLYFIYAMWNHQQTGYFGMVTCDNFCLFSKVIFLITCGGAVMLSRDYLVKRGMDRPEYYAMMLISTSGMMFMVSSSNLMVIFIGLEIMSLPLYVLAGFFKDDVKSTESAAKYFFMGAFASAFLLYGIALVYGGTGTTDLSKIFMSTGIALQKNELYLIIGAALILIGFAFKIAAFPFHMWVPDVYQGAPTPVTAFFSIGPKAAGIAVLLRIFIIGFGGVYESFTIIFWILAFLTMATGNIFALMQNDVKRMLAYSSIAHAGYLMLALTAGSSEAVSAALFYLLAYSFFNMGAFAIVTIVENKTGTNHIDTYKGLASRHPWLAVFLALFMFSLAGFPPTAGFIGKFYIFSAAIKANLVWLVVAAVMNSLISVYYYLRPIKAAFFEKAEGEESSAVQLTLGPLMVVAIIITSVGALGLGLFPNYFLKLAAASGLMMM